MITPPRYAAQRSDATLPPPASNCSVVACLRCQVWPSGEVHSTALVMPPPGGAGMFSPTAMKPNWVRARPRILSPADIGRAGAVCQVWPFAEVQADCWPSASQPFGPRTASTGVAPEPSAAPGAALLGSSAARAQVRPPFCESRISGRDSGAAPCEPTATIVLPAPAIPVSAGGGPDAPAGPAKSESARAAGG